MILTHIFLICRIGFWRGIDLIKFFSEQIDKDVLGKQPNRKGTSEQGVPFVATHHRKLKDLGKLIENLQLFLIFLI